MAIAILQSLGPTADARAVTEDQAINQSLLPGSLTTGLKCKGCIAPVGNIVNYSCCCPNDFKIKMPSLTLSYSDGLGSISFQLPAVEMVLVWYYSPTFSCRWDNTGGAAVQLAMYNTPAFNPTWTVLSSSGYTVATPDGVSTGPGYGGILEITTAGTTKTVNLFIEVANSVVNGGTTYGLWTQAVYQAVLSQELVSCGTMVIPYAFNNLGTTGHQFTNNLPGTITIVGIPNVYSSGVTRLGQC